MPRTTARCATCTPRRSAGSGARYLSARQTRNSERVLSQHGAILDALRTRDPDAVGQAIETHLHGLAHDIAASFADRPSP